MKETNKCLGIPTKCNQVPIPSSLLQKNEVPAARPNLSAFIGLSFYDTVPICNVEGDRGRTGEGRVLLCPAGVVPCTQVLLDGTFNVL